MNEVTLSSLEAEASPASFLPPGFTLSPQQDAAFAALRRWWNSGHPETPIFVLSGYAGTGKTTIAKAGVSELVGGDFTRHVAPMAFSGKAASVMRRKGMRTAGTIHSWVYSLVQPDEGKYQELKRRRKALLDSGDEKAARAVLNEMKMLAKPRFVINDQSELCGKRIALLDEVSMANEEIKRDLLHFGIPIVALGDPGQLPPIEGSGAFFSQRPNAMLTEIHRQALESPIIRMASDVRQGRGVAQYNYPEARVVKDQSALGELCSSSEQVLVGKNDTRRKLNFAMRDAKGFSPLLNVYPQEHERVICLRNSRDLGILNGQQFTVLSSEDGSFGIKLQIAPLDPEPGREDDPPILVEAHRAYFDEYQHGGILKQLTHRDFVGSQEFDFGYAITCHKAQGSQWGSILVYDDKFGVWDRDLRAKWMYTAVTRAESRVVVFDPKR